MFDAPAESGPAAVRNVLLSSEDLPELDPKRCVLKV
jgi:hypothetical protein